VSGKPDVFSKSAKKIRRFNNTIWIVKGTAKGDHTLQSIAEWLRSKQFGGHNRRRGAPRL
jgi:hypothetical protein